MIWRPVWALIERELMRMVRQRGRLVSALVRPLIWLLVIGGGFGALLGDSQCRTATSVSCRPDC